MNLRPQFSLWAHGWWLLLVSALVLTTACDSTIHEYPDEMLIKQDFLLEFNFTADTDLPDYTLIERPLARSASQVLQAQMPHRFRYVVNVYRADAESLFGRVPAEQFTYFSSATPDQHQSFRMQLLPGRYRFITWVDYVLDGSTEPLYYDASDFEEIKYMLSAGGSYQGNTPWRDAFVGQADADVLPMNGGRVEVPMERPLAKYRFVTTDLQEFIEREINSAAERARQESTTCHADSSNTSTPSSSIVGADPKADTRGIDLSRYHVVLFYPMFVPCSYNVFTGRPADSWSGKQFDGQIKQLNADEAELGFDFVLVNHQEALTTVGLALYDSDGHLLSRTDPITLPLKRSMLTTVKGKFLTSRATGNVGIDASFDGEYNIEIK